MVSRVGEWIVAMVLGAAIGLAIGANPMADKFFDSRLILFRPAGQAKKPLPIKDQIVAQRLVIMTQARRRVAKASDTVRPMRLQWCCSSYAS